MQQRLDLPTDAGSITVERGKELPLRSFEVGDGFGPRTGDKSLGVRYAAAFREHWIYVLLTVALAVVGAAAYLQLADERYEATAEVFVATVPPDTLRGLPVLRENMRARNILAVALLTKSPQVTSRVRENLRLSLTPSAVGDLVTVGHRSGVLSITGIGGSPEAAATTANAFADALVAERTRRFQTKLRQAIQGSSRRLNAIANRAGSAEAASLSNRLADYRALSGQPDPTLEVVGAAVPPSSPAWPRPLMTMLVAVVGGVLVGMVVAMALELANPLVVRTDALAEPNGPPMLARVPRLTDFETRQLLVNPGTASPRIRQEVRIVSAIVSGLLPTTLKSWSTPRTVLVTGPGSGEGSPSVAARLAGSIARSGMSVALIDFDLERGPLATIVDGGMSPAPSIGQILIARDAPALLDRIEPISPSHRLHVLLAKDDAHLSEWFPPDRFAALVEYLKSRFQAVVISAPPLPSTEASALLGSADAVVIVVAMGRTRRDQLAKLREVLATRDIAPVGYVALERRSFSTRLSRMVSHAKPPARRRWAQRAHRVS